MNCVLVIGELRTRPEIRSGGHAPSARFLLAAARRFHDRRGHLRTATDLIPVVVYGALAKRLTILDPGDRIAVRGSLRTWEIRSTDRPSWGFHLVADHVEVMRKLPLSSPAPTGEPLPAAPEIGAPGGEQGTKRALPS